MGTNANYTLEENLALTNEELTSNWSKLASFVKLYEGIPWDEARPKAIDLLRYGKAVHYIEQIREIISGKISKPLVQQEKTEDTPLKEPAKTSKKSSPKLTKAVDIHQVNFNKLLRIVPDLQERLLSGEEVYGKSKRTGYMGFNLELLHHDKTGYYLALSHYYKENGDMIADPDMVVLINLENQTLIPLSFQDRYKYKLTFDDVYKRKLVNLKELKSQASFLSFWLGNLKKQGHKIKWKESDGTGELKKELMPLPIKEEKPQELNDEPQLSEQQSQESTEIEQILKHWKRFASFIRKNEDISQELAEEKARKLKEEDKDWEYLEHALEKKDKVSNEHLFRENYKALIALIPNLREHLKNEEMKGVLSGSKASLMHYEVGFAKALNSTTSCISIFEMPEKEVSKLGILILAINRIRKMAWIHLLDGDFFGMASFDDKEVAQDAKVRYTINKKLGRWFDLLIGADYKVNWQHTQDAKAIEPVEPKQDINQEIPDFNVGEVQLTEAHIRAGLTQKHINWINKNRQGMVITPRRQMSNNTKDFLMDQTIQAKKPGFRVSKTGKLYYEGRSNRSDLTSSGL